MNTYAKSAPNPSGMNTYKIIDSKSRVMNTYEKMGGGGAYLLPSPKWEILATSPPRQPRLPEHPKTCVLVAKRARLVYNPRTEGDCFQEDEMRKPVKRMLGVVLLCAGIAAGVVGGAWVRPAAAADDDAAVAKADQAFAAAVGAGDKAALGKLLDAGFSWTEVDGKTLTRSAALAELPKPSD